MVIDCQACGAQQRIDDTKLPATGVVICRSCGANIRIGAKPRSADEDETVVAATRPVRRDPTGLGGSLGPIPLSGTSDRHSGAARPSQGMDLGAIGVSNRRETKQFDVKTSEIQAGAKGGDDEPIPLLDADDILDFDEIDDDDQTKTIPGVALSDLTRSSTKPTPSFLEDVPTVIPGPSANDAPTRFNRNLTELDDLPSSAAKADATKSAAPRPAPRPPSAAPRPPSTGTMPTQTIKPATPAPVKSPVSPAAASVAGTSSFGSASSASAYTSVPASDWATTQSFTQPKTEPIPLPVPAPELPLDSSFAAPLEIPAYPSTPLPVPEEPSFAPPADTAPADFGNFDNLPQWAPVEATVTKATEEAPPALDFDLPSDLPAPSPDFDLPASLDAPVTSDASAYGSSSYAASTPPTTPAYDSNDYVGGDSTMQMNRADLGIDFGSELPTPASTLDLAPPSFEMEALPNDLPSDLPNDLPAIGDTTQVGGTPRIELEGDLPTSQGSGFVLNDDLPMPSIGLATDGPSDDLPQPSYDTHDQAVPSLMDNAPPQETTQVVREERSARDDLPPVPARPTVAADNESEVPPPKKKSSGARVAILALVLVGGVLALATKFPEYVPFELPWAPKPQPIAETPPTPLPPPTPVTPTEQKTAEADKPTEPEVPAEEPRVIPALTLENVNELDFTILRAAATNLAADASSANGPGRSLLQWARYRLARWGDTAARDALLADAPVLTPQSDELTAATAIGVQLLQNKPMVARKNAERLAGPGPSAKAKMKDSVPVLLVLAASSEKPPFKAIQVNDRVLALAPKAIDARLGKVEAELAMPKPEIRKQGIADAIALAKDTKSVVIAVRLAGLLMSLDAASAVADVASPLSSIKQADDLAPGQLGTFTRLLAHRAAIAGDFEAAKQAIDLAIQASLDDVNLVRTAGRIAAASGADYATLLGDARNRARDVEAKATLIDEQVKLALSRGDVAGAKAAQAFFADLAPRPALSFAKLSEARVLSAEGKVDQAKLAAMQSLKARPKTLEARLFVIAGTKLPPAGELAQLTMLDKQAASADVDVRLAQAMNERSNAGGAAELYARSLWREPIAVDPVGVVIALADATERSGNAERAGTYLSALRKNVGGDERLGKALLTLARRHGGGADAVAYFEAASSKNPTDMALRLQYAQALTDAGKGIEAQTMLDTLLRTPEGAKSPDVLRELGRAWKERDSVKARSYVNDAIHMSPDAASYELLGQIEEAQSKLDDAMDAYRKAVKADSTSNSARVRLARVQVARGQWADAAAQLRDIVQHDPSNLQAIELLGDALRDTGKPREAIVWYKKALDVSPDSVTLMMKFARVQIELGAVQPAAKSFRRVIQVHPEVAEAHYHLGYALKDMGKTGEAKSELEEYLKMKPDGEYATEVKNELQDLAR